MLDDTTGGSLNPSMDDIEQSAPAGGTENSEEWSAPQWPKEQTTLKHRSFGYWHKDLQRFVFSCQAENKREAHDFSGEYLVYKCPWYVQSANWDTAIEAANQHAHRMRFQ